MKKTKIVHWINAIDDELSFPNEFRGIILSALYLLTETTNIRNEILINTAYIDYQFFFCVLLS